MNFKKKLKNFQEKFMICTFLIQLTQFEKAGLICQIYILVGNPKIKSILCWEIRKLNSTFEIDHVFGDLNIYAVRWWSLPFF